jgi:hypothetical protein
MIVPLSVSSGVVICLSCSATWSLVSELINLLAPRYPYQQSRRTTGYHVVGLAIAAMMVEESRILQVCIFHTLEKNLDCINFSVVLRQVMTIADGEGNLPHSNPSSSWHRTGGQGRPALSR